MVYSILTNGLANNLFQIATGASLAHSNNTEYIACTIEETVPEGMTFNGFINQFQSNTLKNVSFVEGFPEDTTEYVQPGFNYNPIPYSPRIRLSGYFQSEKFFDKEYVRELFSLDKDKLLYIRNKYGKLLDQEIISIHVRRGDYVNRPLRQPVCCMPYFRRAIKYFGKYRQYFVFSDDIAWCRKRFTGSNFHFPDHESPVIDLYLQSLCTHNIISNSSYSWWGAWLNQNPSKIVIVPKTWFGIQMRDYNLTDLIPEEWIKIKNPRTLALTLKIAVYWSVDISKRAFWRLKHL
ncbi:MAG: alpha-1,2-fucosyltransferase [Rikenellaceae bacterium]